VLTKALREFEGALVVISHDREFLEKLEPTHVLSVRGGKAVIEERGLRESDWNDPLDSRTCESETSQKYASSTTSNSTPTTVKGSET